MLITHIASERSFYLQSPGATYAIAIHPDLGIPLHRFWGGRIDPADASFFTKPVWGVAFSPNRPGTAESESPDILAQELPTFGHGDFRASALTVEAPDGSRLLEPRYTGHRITPGKPALPGLPATYVESPEEAETLELDLADERTGLRVTLFYTVFRDFDAIARSVRVHNAGTQPLQIAGIASASVDFSNRPLDLIHLSGAWARERHVQRQRLLQGERVSVGSRRGASSHQAHPFLALLEPEAGETHGEVFGLSLVYSGDFSASAEVDPFLRPRVQIGLNPDTFSWRLEPGETFHAPEAVLAHSAHGLGGLSRTYHALYRTRLARGHFRDRPRPCLLNNWEATYFGFNEEKLLALAQQGATLGIELFVLDDGWFGKRDSDDCSLGDWVVDRRKLPGGIDGIARKINALGMQFGLWFEPEMISPDSDLYRAHPDWCLHVAGRERSLGRKQLILDLSRPEVCDYVIDAIGSVLASAPIAYVKWDMNRHMTEAGSPALPAARQREVPHRYMLGLYRVLETLTARFPEILFEGCSGGGGRFDPGLLHYMPQSWTSDNSDAVSRLKIQYGTSLVYPWSALAAHVSAVPNHQHGRVTPLATRFHVALTGAFGYELDLGQLPQEELDAIRAQVAFYKEHRELLARGTFHRLRDPFTGNEAAWIVVAPGRAEALAVHVAVQVEANQLATELRLRGLDPDAAYVINGQGPAIKGNALQNAGLVVPAPKGDFASHCWYLRRVE